MTTFPAQIDNNITLPLVEDNLTPITGEVVNRLRNAIIAVEAELGVKPSGTYTTVKARLDAIENSIANFQINGLGGDVVGTLLNTTVIKFQNRPFSSQAPHVSDVIAWNGIAWVPTALDNITINVLPTTVVLPSDINFLSGDGYSNSSTPTRIGARVIDTALYPATYPDGRTRTMTFRADLEVTNGSTDGYVQIKDTTHNIVIINSLLHTRSTSSIELSAIITSGPDDGYIIDTCCDSTMYEVQIFILNGGGGDQVICRNARIEIIYSSPINVSALVPLALPVDLQFVCGTILNGFTTPAGIGGRLIDMSKLPPALPDGRVRSVKFTADIEVSAPGVDGYIQLFDTTNNVLITNSKIHFTNTIISEVITPNLVIGSSNGNIRSDASTRYEVQIWKVSGSPADRVICNNARVTVVYT